MDTPASLVPASARRAGANATTSDIGSVLYQANRLDVLVHLLAFEHLSGEELPLDEAKDWVAWSDTFAAQDNEPSVATLAAELMTSPNVDLEVVFASGGQLVRGASAAAGAIYSDREATRRDGTDKVIDRSVAALQDQGWTASQIHRLLIEWACRDDASVAVLIDLEAEGATEAIHELTCRYEAMHQELEFVSLADADELQIDEGGSTQVLCLRASGPSLGDVLARHASAVRCSASGPAAAAMLTTMWNSNRSVESSPTHAQRIRKMRRRELTDQFLARTLGR